MKKITDNFPYTPCEGWSQEEENELQTLVIKIKWKHPTYEDMERCDELTRKKWKAQGKI